MKKYLLKISLIGSILILLIAIGEYVVRQDINPYQYKHRYIIENGDNITTLVLGSSHTYFGIKPNLISESAFSLANGSQPLLYDYYMLENYISDLPNLQHVILDVGYLSLRSTGFSVAASRKYTINYCIYMDFPQISSFSSLNLMCSEMALFRSKLSTMLKQANNLTCDEFGWGEDYNITKKKSDWDDATAAIKRHTGGENYNEKVFKNIENISRIAELCRSNNVELIIISMPIWHTYRDNLDQAQLNDVYSALERLNKKYEFNFYDYSEDVRFELDDFYDSDHLSNIGAEKFSRILADTLGL